MSQQVSRQPYIPKKTTPIGFYKESGITRPITSPLQRTVYVPSHQYGKIFTKFTHDLSEFGRLKSQHLAKKVADKKAKSLHNKIDKDLDAFVRLGLLDSRQYTQLKNELDSEYTKLPHHMFPSSNLRKKMNTVARLAFAEYQIRQRDEKERLVKQQEEAKEQRRLENLQKPERSDNDPFIPFSKKTKDFEDEIIGHDQTRKENIHASGKRTPIIEESDEEIPDKDNSGFEEKLAVLSATQKV